MKNSFECFDLKDKIIHDCILYFFLKQDLKEAIISNLNEYAKFYNLTCKKVSKIERNTAFLRFIDSGQDMASRINNLYSVL